MQSYGKVVGLAVMEELIEQRLQRRFRKDVQIRVSHHTDLHVKAMLEIEIRSQAQASGNKLKHAHTILKHSHTSSRSAQTRSHSHNILLLTLGKHQPSPTFASLRAFKQAPNERQNPTLGWHKTHCCKNPRSSECSLTNS